MEKIIKLKKTGIKYPTKQVESGHKKGILCLTCGILTGGLICDKCKELKKCKLCGIVCKVEPTNRIYCYQQDPSKKEFSFEHCRDVDTICRTLNEEGLCETCINWENEIDNKCHNCLKDINNSFKHYKECGNVCNCCNYIYNLKTKNKTNFDCGGIKCGMCKICSYLAFLENSKYEIIENIKLRDVLLEEYIIRSYPQVKLCF